MAGPSKITHLSIFGFTGPNFTIDAEQEATGASSGLTTVAGSGQAIVPTVGQSLGSTTVVGSALNVLIDTTGDSSGSTVVEASGTSSSYAIGSSQGNQTVVLGVSGYTRTVTVPRIDIEVHTGGSFYAYEFIESCSGESVPKVHVEDSKKLDADAYVDLFELHLSDGTTRVYLKMNKTTEWQGHTYEGTGIKIEGVGTYADDEVARPKLTIFNPEGVYSYLVDQGLLENARVVRIRVLKEHIEDDVPVFRKQQWYIKRVASVRRTFIGLELRDMIDGQNFLTPGRMFIPPDFPTVSLQ